MLVHLKSFNRALLSNTLIANKWQQASVSHNLSRHWKKPIGYDTGIVVYHPLVKEKVPFILLNDKILRWYACGPTVYDSAHIGHASSYVRQDIIRRIVQRVFGISVVHVLGMTDVDDKIIDKSLKVNKTIKDVSTLYEAEFFADMSKLNVLTPTVISRVTDHIPTIVDFIQGLEQHGFAYKASDGSVYFDVEKYGRYGVFSNPQQNENEQETSTVKRSFRDFALWKAQKPLEPVWNSPWDDGRPGWHIECSAMASKIFGSLFDLHSGGDDLTFPHHENELAQSCAFHNTSQWVNYWLHTGKLYLSGQDEKMSKSLNNVISVSELLENYTSNHFRMLCLITGYRKRIDFSDERMNKAISTVNTFNNFLNRCEVYTKGQMGGSNISESEIFESLEYAKKSVTKAYADDFNTPQALAILMRLVKFTSQAFGESEEDEDDANKSPISKASHMRTPAAILAVSVYVKNQLEMLGLDIGKRKFDNSSHMKAQFDDVVNLTVSSRNKIRDIARNKKQFFDTAGELGIPKEKAAILMKKTFGSLWNLSDEIRVQLLKRADVEIRDGKEGSTWTVAEPIKNIKVLHTNKDVTE